MTIDMYLLKRVREWLDTQDNFNCDSNIGFEWYGQFITHPFIDDTGRFEVDPIEYYGIDNINEFLKKFKAENPDF